MASVWEELKRRNVVKVAVAYAVVAWLLVQVVGTVLPFFAAPNWIGRVFMFFVVLGFPIALVIAWAYELTPDGIERADAVAASESITSVTGRKLERVTIGALVLALAFFVFKDQLGLPVEEATVAESAATVIEPVTDEEANEVLPNSVAVLLCDNLSPNPDDAYFSASIHEEILNQLVKISSLNVIARTSVLQYAEDPLPIPEVARELNVGAVMECSVRFAGTAIMVTAQLIDPVTNSHLWSDTYPGDMSDLSAVFEMQADIAMNIANALRAEFSVDEQERLGKQATVSAEAYTLYLKSISLQGAGPVARIRLLDEAIELDPEFALAYARKAQRLASAMRFGSGRTPEREQLTIDLAEKALSIDPDLAGAQLALAAVHELNWRRADAESTYAKALKLYPNDPDVALSYAIFKRATGEYEEAIRLAQIAARLDPNTRNNWHQLAVIYMHAENNDAAYPAIQNSLALGPNSLGSNFELGWVYIARGDLVAARDQFREYNWSAIQTAAPALLAWSAIGLERAGLQQEAEQVAADFLKRFPSDPTTSISRATVYVANHEYDLAYEELEKAVNGPVPLEINSTIEFKVNRWGHPVLEEPRFVALRDKLGFQD